MARPWMGVLGLDGSYLLMGGKPRHHFSTRSGALLPVRIHSFWQEYLLLVGAPREGSLELIQTCPAGLLGTGEEHLSLLGPPMSQVGMPFCPLAAVALGLTLADGELGTVTLTPLPVHQDTGATCRWAGEQRLGGRWGAGGTGGVGTHSGNAGFLVVAHTPVHGSHNEDVFRLGLTVKQGGGSDFACRTEGWGGPGRGQGRKERVRDMGTMWQCGCKCVSVCVHMPGVWGGALEGREGSTHALGTGTSEMAI